MVEDKRERCSGNTQGMVGWVKTKGKGEVVSHKVRWDG